MRGSLSKTIEAIKYLKEAKSQLKSSTPCIEAQFIVFKFNQHQINEFKQLAPIWGANKISIKSAQIHSPNENFKIIPTINKYSRYHKVNNEWKIKKDYSKACFRVWNGMVVSADGNILPCCFGIWCCDPAPRLPSCRTGRGLQLLSAPAWQKRFEADRADDAAVFGSDPAEPAGQPKWCHSAVLALW